MHVLLSYYYLKKVLLASLILTRMKKIIFIQYIVDFSKEINLFMIFSKNLQEKVRIIMKVLLKQLMDYSLLILFNILRMKMYLKQEVCVWQVLI
jgi:hypothetical protein